MPITTRTDRLEFPGSVTEITEPFTCANYPTMQLLAKALQEQVVVGSYGTIVAGRIVTNLTKGDVETTLCGP